MTDDIKKSPLYYYSNPDQDDVRGAALVLMNDAEAMSHLSRLLIGNKSHTVRGALHEIAKGKHGKRQT